MQISANDYDELVDRLKKLSYASDYIPSADALDSIMEMEPEGKILPDRFVTFLIWVDMHHPEPTDEEEQMMLKRIRKILYTSVEITEEASGRGYSKKVNKGFRENL
mgnify:CR=1 FL=1